MIIDFSACSVRFSILFRGPISRARCAGSALSGKHRGVRCWRQFVSMLFGQLGRAHGLREIEQGLRSCEGEAFSPAHRGGGEILALVRERASALANLPRCVSSALQALSVLIGAAPGRKMTKFRFKNKLVNLDSSVIDLRLSMYDWAKFCTTQGAIKLPLLFDYYGTCRDLR